MTPEDELDLMMAAKRIAGWAPPRRGQYVARASIPWSEIEKLRALLDRMGIEWRAFNRRVHS